MPLSIQQSLALLRQCEEGPPTPKQLDLLRSGLNHRSNLVVERAAEIAAAHKCEALEEELLAAYQRFVTDNASDRSCSTKATLCEALRAVGYDDFNFYLRGIRYHQFSHGSPPVDVAAQLRVNCGFALAEFGYPSIMRELVDLLADAEKTARAGAAKAIAWVRNPGSEAILRLKVRLGDSAAEVVGECFAGLLSLEPQASLSLVVSYLESEDRELIYEAAIALGESRVSEAFEPLKALAVPNRDRELQEGILMAIALLQRTVAVDFLLSLVAGTDIATGRAAIRALRHCRDQQLIRERLGAIVQRCEEDVIRRTFTEEFDKYI